MYVYLSQIPNGFTVLMWACLNKQVPLVKLLLDRGADVSLKDKVGIFSFFI